MSNKTPVPRASVSDDRAKHMQRRAKHMTQEAIAAEFGKSRRTVGRALKRGYTKGGSAHG